jgi:feruloyl esterase
MTADTAKAAVAKFYGQAPAHSYFNGCSLGGRQAWLEIQRFPADFDGVLAGDAFNDYNVAKMELNWNQQWQLKNAAHYVSSANLVNVGHATVAACDALDGLVDGLIDDPRKCKFDPATIQCSASTTQRCLSAGQVETMKMLYQGARTSTGQQLTPGCPDRRRLPIPMAR